MVRPLPIWALDKKRNINPCLINRAEVMAQQDKLLADIRHRNDFSIIDLSVPFCDDRCGEIDDSHYLYMPDGNHLNNEGIKKLSKYLSLNFVD
jgi:hypothetical protein